MSNAKVRLSDVPGYLETNYGWTVTRQTVYNWAKVGKRGVLLQTAKSAGNLFTTWEWVDDFVCNVPE